MRPFITVFLLTLSVVGCASRTSVIVPDDLPTMKDIYEQQFQTKEGIQKEDLERKLHAGEEGWNTHIQKQMRPLRKAFTFLPNPTLTMFIFPHLTDAGSPVPGYTTFFKFYERDHVGLPSETYQSVEPVQKDRKHSGSNGIQ